MIQIPSAVLVRFETCLEVHKVSERVRVYYKKWLRFYLDFCSKYQRDAKESDSLADFLRKLSEKGKR